MLHVSIDKNKNNPNNICCDWDVLCETGTSLLPLPPWNKSGVSVNKV